MSSFLLAILFASASSASFAGNLNYGSPSARHPALGVPLAPLIKRQTVPESVDISLLRFTHGVASGDPYEDSVILWTRVSPNADNESSDLTEDGVSPSAPPEDSGDRSIDDICVNYRVASDEDFTNIKDEGRAYTSAEVDYTIKVH